MPAGFPSSVCRLVLPCIPSVIRDALGFPWPVCCSATVNSSSGSWPWLPQLPQTPVPLSSCVSKQPGASHSNPRISEIPSLPLSSTAPHPAWGCGTPHPRDGTASTGCVPPPPCHGDLLQGSITMPRVPTAPPAWGGANETRSAAVLYNKV